MSGDAGTEGAPGADGDPAGMGGPGGPGESVSALADAAGESNSATATGGQGGAGGPGGNAPDASVPAGAGGLGGAGGNAEAVADTVGATGASATATGGDAGEPGADGSGAPPVPVAGPGNAGGGATATATLEYAGDELAEVTALAEGGSQVSPDGATGAGGAASASASGTAGTGGITVTSTAQGGDAATTTGSADSDASGVASGDGTVSVLAIAQSGDPGLFGPFFEAEQWGDASASAFGESTGSGSVDVAAIARTPAQRSTVAPNLLSVTAEGHSQAGDVTATAIQELSYVEGGGVLAEMHDAVSGSTSGQLTLQQRLVSAAGDTSTSLRASHAGGLSLEVEVGGYQSISGQRFPTGGDSADVYLGDVIGSSTGAGDVSVLVEAAAGSTLADADGSTVLQQNLAAGGASTPSVIRGESNGGAVQVGAFFSASPAATPQTSAAPAGGSIDMTNAVVGATTGDLILLQSGSAGAGGEATSFSPPARGGDGGSATGTITHAGDSTSIRIINRMSGGDSGVSSEGFESAQAGAARTTVDVSNQGGSIEIDAAATGGSDGWGGSAEVDVRAETSGDGNDVRIRGGETQRTENPFFLGQGVPRSSFIAGSIRRSFLGTGARAGSGERIRVLPFFPPPTDVGELSDGGDATSRSVGIANGDSEVEVLDFASGGGGGGVVFPVEGRMIGGTAGDGGAALSTAVAERGGSSSVMARAHARGGFGGFEIVAGGNGGDATATASATGLGAVESQALAQAGGAGNVTRTGVAGDALATAGADGASGFAMAMATTGGNLQVALGATARADVASPVDARSQATFGAALPGTFSATDFQADAFVTGDPLAGDVEAAARDNAALADLLATTRSEVVALGAFDALATDGAASSTRSIALDITLTDRDAGNRLRLAAFDIAAIGDGFEQLSFRLERGGDAFGETEVFDDFAAALAFFENGLFDVGPGSDGALSAIFDVTLGEGDGFGMRLAFVVPEPSTGLLLGLALVALSLRRRRRAH